MPVDLATPAFLAAVALSALMGFAIQRGATCSVAAIDEIIDRRSATRLLGMLEAALWVAGLLLLASVLHLTSFSARGYQPSWGMAIGAVLLGLGAWVNRACVFGAVARLGSGQWSYLATPLGFYLGCLAYSILPGLPRAMPAHASSPLLATGPWGAFALLAFMLWRAARTRAIWSPGAATVVIGIAFVAMLVLVGESWAYTDVLAELSRGMGMHLAWRGVLLLALFGGALLGGYTARLWKPAAMSWRLLLRCCCGGALMGVGSQMIPGSNDGLILLGLPFLWPHAWIAFLLMCATVAGAILLGRE
ncbi:MAG: YeeE/YedE thiosulfate transporter family protein [Pseudomonadota bacterium]